MENSVNKVKIAINGGIGFGAKLNSKQLMTISKYMNEEDELELTTFQQLYIEIPENRKEEIIEELKCVGLACYPVGNFVKSLRTCNFCKGEEEEGMPVAKELNRRIAGKAKGKDAEIGPLLMENLTPEELYETVEKMIAVYAQMGKKRETFSKFLKRIGREQLLS